jgi:uncharacterized delta-60 repeat protein
VWNFFLPPALKPRVNRARRRCVRPRLEVLEDRCCPSGGKLEWDDPHIATVTDNAMAVAVYPTTGTANDGKVVQVGSIYPNTINAHWEARVMRFNRDGSMDTTFGKSGVVYINALNKNTGYGIGTFSDAVALQPDGKIVVGGYANLARGLNYDSEYVVARLNANGDLDKTFAQGGMFVYNPTTYTDGCTSLALLPDGSILVGGTQYVEQNTVLKLTSSGTLDTNFGSGGVAVVPVPYRGQPTLDPVITTGVTELALVPTTGQIALATGAAVAVLTPSGQLDTSFNGTGYVAGHGFNAVVVQQESATLYEIVTSDASVVGRYFLSGAVDTAFGGAGTGFFTAGGGLTLHNLALETDGSIIIAGSQSYTAGDGSQHTEMAVGHLSANGTLDTSFGSNGTGFVLLMIGLDSSVTGLAINPSTGEIVVTGPTTASSGSSTLTAIAQLSGP